MDSAAINMDQSLKARFSILDFYADYAALLDASRFDDWPLCFTQEALYRIVPRENRELGLPIAAMSCEGRAMMADRVASIKETMMARPRYLRHFQSMPVVRQVSAHDYHVSGNVLVVETMSDQLTRIVLAGGFEDQVVATQTGCLLKDRCVIYDTLLLPDSLTVPV